MSTHDTAVRAVLAQAAVCERFDAQALVAAITDPAQRRAALQQLARDALEIEHDGAFRWTLQQPARQRILAELSDAEFERALVAQSQDALARQIAAIIGKNKVAAGNGAVRYRALELLRLAQSQGAAIARQDLGQQARQSRADLNRQSATASLQSTLRSPLRGRAGELRLLREFAGAGARAIEAQYAPLTGAVLHRANLAQRRWPDVPALLLSGSGGVGKSALVAELIRKERRPGWDGRVVVHFDFDEPALKAGDQGAMLLEVARQIALARPALDEALSASRANLRRSLLDIERSPSGAYERLKFAITVELSSWKPLLAAHEVNDLLLILDTLEEVTVVDFARLDALFGWLDTLRVDAGLRRVHVIGSGRALVSDGSRPRLWPYFLAELALGDLGARAARAMLRDRLTREKLDLHVEQVWRCVEVFGSNPLVLSILARYCVDNDVDALISLLDQARSEEGLKRFGYAAQRFLYGRILERVRDEAIRPLANPGLVLRRVTPTLIQEVLAGPCGLGAIDTAQARNLLQKLQRLAWLVTPDGDGLRHRRDVRRQMLGLILDREGERAVAVNQAAARWYAAQADVSGARDAALLESWYHRGLLGEIASDSEADLRALGDHLGEDVEDLPSNVRSLVKFASGGTLTPVEQAALPTPLQEVVSTRQARTLRQEGLDSAAFGKASVKPAASVPTPPPRRATGEGEVQTPFEASAHEATTVVPVAVPTTESSPVFSDTTQSGESLGRDPDAPPDRELVRAMFALGEFEQVAGFLPALLNSFLQRTRQGESTMRLADDPVYLAAVAARAFGEPRSLGLEDLIHELQVFSGELSQRYSLALQCLSLQILLRASLLDGKSADITYRGSLDLDRIVLLQPLDDWKLALACAMSTGSRRGLISLATLPFLSLALLDLQHRGDLAALHGDAVDVAAIDQGWKREIATTTGARDWRSVLVANAFAISHRGALVRRLGNRGRWELGAINATADQVRGVEVAFDVSAARGSGFSPVGLVPELYAPIRSAFQSELQPEQIARLIERVAEPFDTWAVELAPNQFESAGTDRRNELLPVLLTIADYHGCLGDLVRAAGANATPDSRIGRVAKLFAAFEAAWAL